MKVAIVYDVPGWAYHRRALILRRYAPQFGDVLLARYNVPDLADLLVDCDLVYLMAYGACSRIRSLLPAATILVCGFNVGAGYRRERYLELAKSADHVIFNNFDNWEHHGRPVNSSWISNGVDLAQFYITGPIITRQPRALSIGSEYHLVHNDDLKGTQLLAEIQPALEAAGIVCDFRTVDSNNPPMSADEMRDWYNTGTIYVVASRHEGTPNPALEAAACGCAVVATRVGNMPELIRHGVNGFLVDRSPHGLLEGILQANAANPAMAVAMAAAIEKWDWKYRATQYWDLFTRLVAEKTEKVAVT